MLSLGIDLGTSSVKLSLVDLQTRKAIARCQYPDDEMRVFSSKPGWAEQDPEEWWNCTVKGIHRLRGIYNFNPGDLACIGIAYQMHGLVLLDKNGQLLRKAIIWSDSRAVETGRNITEKLGVDYCFENLLNKPGNFTMSKLKWVKDNEEDIFGHTYKFMLPGDYLAFRFTGEISTTHSGLSEAIAWNFKNQKPDTAIFQSLDINPDLKPDHHASFYSSGKISSEAARSTGLSRDTLVAYRAGDQPNNALSLSCFSEGDIALSAGTSGVVYALSKNLIIDRQSRINTFAHVNSKLENMTSGSLLCINGCGSAYAWIRKICASYKINYDDIENALSLIDESIELPLFHPFGNGAERMLGNMDPGASFSRLNFYTHGSEQIFASVLQGVAFSFYFGIEYMRSLGIPFENIRAAHSGLFNSKYFRKCLSSLIASPIELINTVGAGGAALAAGIGTGYYNSPEEALLHNNESLSIEPESGNTSLMKSYKIWKEELNSMLDQK